MYSFPAAFWLNPPPEASSAYATWKYVETPSAPGAPGRPSAPSNPFTPGAPCGPGSPSTPLVPAGPCGPAEKLTAPLNATCPSIIENGVNS